MDDHASAEQQAEAMRERLAGIPAVDHVVLDESRREVCLIIRTEAAGNEVAEAAREIAGAHTVHVTCPAERRERQRVRFVRMNRHVDSQQQVHYDVTLEWGGDEKTGSAAGEKGESLELRTAASATLAAITSLVVEPLGIRLAGVKQVRAFDADLLVVSLYRPEGQPRNLVGAVVASEDAARGAVNAVLNSLNRLLGNYLSRP